MIEKLMELRNEVKAGKWNRKAKEFWFGADLLICDEPYTPDPNGFQTPFVVVTEHALALSAMVSELGMACRDWLNYANKEEFYGRIGMAIAEEVRMKRPLQRILLRAVEEAMLFDPWEDRKVYVAYGSNMDEEQMRSRCPDALYIAKTVLNGYRFALDEAGVATLIPRRGAHAEVVLWLISPEDEKALDRYEGVAYNCYRKEKVSVMWDGEFASDDALIYISNRKQFDGKVRGGYMEKIIAAAVDHDFTENYIKKLKSLLRSDSRA